MIVTPCPWVVNCRELRTQIKNYLPLDNWPMPPDHLDMRKLATIATMTAVLACQPPPSSKPSPEELCLELADIYAQKCDECGYFDYDQCYEEFEVYICDVVQYIRNPRQFVHECLPQFEDLSCQDFLSGNVPPSCLFQLLI